MTTLDSKAAAAILQSSIPEPEGFWSTFLMNNRRPERNPTYRIPFAKTGGAIEYRRDDLELFAEWEKRRRAVGLGHANRVAEVVEAFGVGQPGGSRFGRELKCQFTPQFNEEAGGHFIQMQVEKPLSIFRLSLDEAKVVLDDLSEVYAAAVRIKTTTNKSVGLRGEVTITIGSP
jgi:hypothetical protein